MLGKVGFTIITIAALISTFSAINASLYGGSKVNYRIAEDDELPKFFLATLWCKPIGLMVTAIASLVVVNFLQLQSISTAGSLGFLLVFGVVNLVGYRLSDHTGSNKLIPLTGFVLCIIATLVLIHQQFTSNRTGVIVSLGITAFCFIAEYFF